MTKCPNCNTTDHEPTAKFCHACGVRLVLSTVPTSVEAVDLGLPSGTKWANINIGATKPEEFGGYYAWGEVEEKELYTLETYVHDKYTTNGYHDIGCNTTAKEHDVAYMKWGGDWKIPSKEQIEELKRQCRKKWIVIHNTAGCEFTGPNGNSIFLPAAGFRSGSYTSLHFCMYWSRTKCREVESSRIRKAFILYADQMDAPADADTEYCDVYIADYQVEVGLPVRPVLNK